MTKPGEPHPNEPVAERRVTGAHWWDPDRIRHAEDAPNFCPKCGEDLDGGIAVEYWEAEDRVYHAWCRSCGWAGDIVKVTRMIAYEAEH